MLLVSGCGDEATRPGGGSAGLTGITVSGGESEAGTGDAQDGDGDGEGEGEGGPADDDDEPAESSGDDEGAKFDLGSSDVPTSGCGGGDGKGGELEFSYIWISNSTEGTVSKIDTVSGVEEGRYRTSAAGSDSPSRTSVNQYSAVAVGNRIGGGGVMKVAATEEDCVERNGVAGIQTSSGAADVLAFLEDECVLWSTPMPIADNGPRAIAWEGGTIDEETCENTVPDPRLWVGYGGVAQEVYRLDGTDGSEIMHITIPSTGGLIYGGAVNAEGDLWMVNRGANQLIRVDSDSYDYETFAIPNTPYGMGVDANGDPWVVSYAGGPGADHVYRFDVASSTFVDAGGTNGYYRGMNLDRDGHVWVGGNSPCRLAKFDAQSDTLVDDNIVLPGCTTPVGVSIDIDGYVWVVDQNGTAFKVDPTTHAIQLTVAGLVGPYTYSDMTGAGLNLVVNPPG